MTITALQVLKGLSNAGYRFEVTCENVTDYAGSSAKLAWQAVLETEEAAVHCFDNETGHHMGHLFCIAPGAVDDEETLADYGGSQAFMALVDSLSE